MIIEVSNSDKQNTECKDWCTLIRTKCSSVLLLRLVRINVHQSLVKSWLHLVWPQAHPTMRHRIGLWTFDRRTINRQGHLNTEGSNVIGTQGTLDRRRICNNGPWWTLDRWTSNLTLKIIKTHCVHFTTCLYIMPYIISFEPKAEIFWVFSTFSVFPKRQIDLLHRQTSAILSANIP